MSFAHTHEPPVVGTHAEIGVAVTLVGGEQPQRTFGRSHAQLLIGEVDVVEVIVLDPPRTPAVFVHTRAHIRVGMGDLVRCPVGVDAEQRCSTPLGGS